MVLMRGLAAAAAVAFIGAVAAGCGGLSKSDADIRCNQQQVSETACFDSNVYAQCESCFERCGDDCLLQAGSCPSQFLCPGDTPVDAGADAL